MQPSCSVQLGPALSLGSEGGSGQLEEKQLFEKFWKGTFKAVAMPRLESVIVASITASRRVTASKITDCQTQTDERKEADLRVGEAKLNGVVRAKGQKHRRVRSLSPDEDLSPRPKGKKKKRKSQRKRKRRRSPSRSLSPLRKKKKKKKKSTRKSRRHRYSSKKSKHSSSSLKHKRKDERRHKKSSRTHSRRKRQYRRSDSSSSQSSTEDRHYQRRSVVHQILEDDFSSIREDSDGALDMKWRPANKSVCKTAPKFRSILSSCSVSSSRAGSKPSREKASRHLLIHSEEGHDYDSGNDTCSPPSSKAGISSNVSDGKTDVCRRLTSPEKLTDNVSDSGNSVTSYASYCKGYDSVSPFGGNGKSDQCTAEVVRPSSSYEESSRRSPESRSRRSRSSRSSRHSFTDSRSPSLSSCSTFSRSPSHSPDWRRRGSISSLSSRGSYSRHSPDKKGGRQRSPSMRSTNRKHKGHRKRRRHRSYSPMKKRRRDSPSHLEARRITSARKRPVPYFRRSPSSNSRCSSVSSWSSLFTRSRSRSLIHDLSRSRSRSHSSYRSYSRSSSWNSVFSRSRSRSSLDRRHKTSRH
ncbi:serine/arginine repetitive matrix protein 4 [Synchiropus picturatus]